MLRFQVTSLALHGLVVTPWVFPWLMPSQPTPASRPLEVALLSSFERNMKKPTEEIPEPEAMARRAQFNRYGKRSRVSKRSRHETPRTGRLRGAETESLGTDAGARTSARRKPASPKPALQPTERQPSTPLEVPRQGNPAQATTRPMDPAAASRMSELARHDRPRKIASTVREMVVDSTPSATTDESIDPARSAAPAGVMTESNVASHPPAPTLRPALTGTQQPRSTTNPEPLSSPSRKGAPVGWTASTSPGHERHRTGAVEATRTYDRQIEQIRGKLRELAILVSATQPDLEPERVTVQLEVGTDGYVHRWALAEPASHHIVSITRDLLHLGEPYPFVPGAVEVKVQLGAR